MSLSLIESSKGYLEFFGIKFSIDNSRLNQLVFDILTTKKTAPHHSMEEHTKQAMNQRGFEYNRSILILILFVYVQIYLQLPFELIHQSETLLSDPCSIALNIIKCLHTAINGEKNKELFFELITLFIGKSNTLKYFEEISTNFYSITNARKYSITTTRKSSITDAKKSSITDAKKSSITTTRKSSITTTRKSSIKSAGSSVKANRRVQFAQSPFDNNISCSNKFSDICFQNIFGSDTTLLDSIGLDSIGLDFIDSGSIGLDFIGLDSIGLNSIGLDFTLIDLDSKK